MASMAWMRADDAGQHAEHAGLGAARRQLGGRRLGDHVAVGRAVLRVEHGDLPSKRKIEPCTTGMPSFTEASLSR